MGIVFCSIHNELLKGKEVWDCIKEQITGCKCCTRIYNISLFECSSFYKVLLENFENIQMKRNSSVSATGYRYSNCNWAYITLYLWCLNKYLEHIVFRNLSSRLRSCTKIIYNVYNSVYGSLHIVSDNNRKEKSSDH